MIHTTKKLASRISVLFLITALCIPAFVYGDEGPIPIRLLNPLKVKTLQELLQLILDIVIIFAVPIIVFFIIYSGFLYVTAQGKPEQIKKATTAITWTIIGAVIVLGAKILLTIITKTVESLQ